MPKFPTPIRAFYRVPEAKAVLHFFKHPNAPKIHRDKKTKRHLTMNEFNEYLDDIIMHRHNVEIVPESRRINKYPNHRYAEDKIHEEPIPDSKGRFPKPLGPKTNEHPYNIQDVILKKEMSDRPTQQQSKFLNEIEMLKGSGASMRLRGVYMQSELPEPQVDESYRYSKEINNLMQKNLGNRVKGRKRLIKNPLKVRGAPFQLPLRGSESQKRKKSNFQQSTKKRPITIYLDFYPMNLHEEFRRKNLKPISATLPGIKLPDIAPKESIKVNKFLPHQRQKNGMILKLNLYPKGETSEEDPRKSAGGYHSENSERAERKSFGWFSKHKKKKNHRKKCSFVGLNPNEKHITAKWKNEKGEWIHAEHVAVKYTKKENDSDKR